MALLWGMSLQIKYNSIYNIIFTQRVMHKNVTLLNVLLATVVTNPQNNRDNLLTRPPEPYV
jgi:hypothetical protein